MLHRGYIILLAPTHHQMFNNKTVGHPRPPVPNVLVQAERWGRTFHPSCEDGFVTRSARACMRAHFCLMYLSRVLTILRKGPIPSLQIPGFAMECLVMMAGWDRVHFGGGCGKKSMVRITLKSRTGPLR